MGEGPGTDGSAGEVTLAFELAAVRALARPRRVFADARGWSRHVGIVGADAATVEGFVRSHGLRQDYELAELDPVGVLSRLKWEADTERYVYVGATGDARELAEHVRWEYVPVEDAAAAAGWTLREDAGPLARVRAALARRLRWLGA